MLNFPSNRIERKKKNHLIKIKLKLNIGNKYSICILRLVKKEAIYLRKSNNIHSSTDEDEKKRMRKKGKFDRDKEK